MTQLFDFLQQLCHWPVQSRESRDNPHKTQHFSREHQFQQPKYAEQKSQMGMPQLFCRELKVKSILIGLILENLVFSVSILPGSVSLPFSCNTDASCQCNKSLFIASALYLFGHNKLVSFLSSTSPILQGKLCRNIWKVAL